MFHQAILFLLGILLLNCFSYLPALSWGGLLFLIFFLYQKWPKIKIIFPIMLGFFWALWVAHQRLDYRLPNNLEEQWIEIPGVIASIPNCQNNRCDFLFKANHFPGLIKTLWEKPAEKIKTGDEWLLTMKLKAIHSTLNPGGFDSERWAFREGIYATAYVNTKASAQFITHHAFLYPLTQIRQYLKTKLEAVLPKTNTSCWIEALVIGERKNISADNWQILRNTGTNHLMAIAGLHIGFLFAFVYGLILFLWRRIPKVLFYLPAQEAAALGSLFIAMLYSALAGFSVPTQRACIMLSIFILSLLLRRKNSAWQCWSLALLLVLIFNPFEVLSESFWLSFSSVALIIYAMSGRLGIPNLWWKWGRIQWVIALGLIPISIWLFHEISLIGFIANSIAIPWIGFLILPTALLGALLLFIIPKAGATLLIFSDKLLAKLWTVLTYFSHLKMASWQCVMPNTIILITSCVGILLLLLPKGTLGKNLGFFWVLPLTFFHPATPNKGEVWLNLLDVGQGLSSVIQTQHHFLVFDAGPRLSEQFDAGENIVTPFLQTLGVRKIDTLVISHGDNDHIGGTKALLTHFDIGSIYSSVPTEVSPQALFCLRGTQWNWDGVEFSFLYPKKENLGFNNDSSCVLSIKTGNQQILLTGDIEKYAEKKLVEENANQLSSLLLIAPHHGSKTSAEDAFLAAVHPSYVLYPVGYHNRYHFPNHSVIEKYATLGTTQLDTVNAGEVAVKISATGLINISAYRINQGHFWNRNL